MMMNRTKGDLLLFGTAFLWSFIGISVKYVSINGILTAGITGAVAFVVVRLCFIRHKFRFDAVTVLSGVVTAGVNITFFLANKYTTVTNSIVLQYSSPIIVLLLNIVFFRYRPAKQQVASIVICMLGMLVFFNGQIGSGNMAGNLLALLSGFLFAVSFILNARPESDPSSSMMIAYLFSFVAAAAYFPFQRQLPSSGDIIVLICIGVLFTGFPSVLYSSGIKHTSALNASMITLSEVFLAPLWALLLYRESLGRFSVLGILLMLGAIIFESFWEKKTSQTAKTVEAAKTGGPVAAEEHGPSFSVPPTGPKNP